MAKAPIGYLNIRERVDGREVRTVVIDTQRGPLVRMAFELYATGTYGFHDLIDALTDAGLRTRPTKKHPAGQPISIARIGAILRNRYYLGYVTHGGVEYKGRHEPLVTQELFERVQRVLDGERGGGTRARVHHHYLKGSLGCPRCSRRLMIMRGKGKRGDLYFYFICRGRRDHTCDLPYLPVPAVEKAVESFYSTISLPAGARERIMKAIDDAMVSDSEINEERRDAIKKQLIKLDNQEDGFLDLVGNPEWPNEKIALRLRRVRDERARLEEQLERTERPDLDAGRAAIGMVLDLLAQPEELYRVASERARRALNQALFMRLYVDGDESGPQVIREEPTSPFAPFIGAYRGAQQNGDAAHV
ncbi:MAG: recombinase family protein, partial [Spirillospora sp.]